MFGLAPVSIRPAGPWSAPKMGLALPSMLANKWGRIINIASAHGLVASPHKSAYVAAKHGIIIIKLLRLR